MHPKYIALIGAFLAVGGLSYRFGLPSNKSISTDQRVIPIGIEGCQYFMITVGDPTNSNFSLSMTHKGNCTNHIEWQQGHITLKSTNTPVTNP